MQFSRKSFSNLQALAQGDFGGSMSELQGGGPLSHTGAAGARGSEASLDSDVGKQSQRYDSLHLDLANIVTSHHITSLQAYFRLKPPTSHRQTR